MPHHLKTIHSYFIPMVLKVRKIHKKGVELCIVNFLFTSDTGCSNGEPSLEVVVIVSVDFELWHYRIVLLFFPSLSPLSLLLLWVILRALWKDLGLKGFVEWDWKDLWSDDLNGGLSILFSVVTIGYGWILLYATGVGYLSKWSRSWTNMLVLPDKYNATISLSGTRCVRHPFPTDVGQCWCGTQGRIHIWYSWGSD